MFFKNSIVAVGGQTGTTLINSVEVFDIGSNIWTPGPSLPFAIKGAALIEDPLGGVIILGGFAVSDGALHNKIYWLPNLATGWVVLEQTLKIPRYVPLAFLVPDSLTNCKIP